jgi:hypothetical protein
MTATVAQFRELMPQFSDVSDSVIQSYLDVAENMMGGGWGDSGDEAQCFLAAHLMSMAGIGPNASAGQLAGFTNIKAGSVSLSRADAAAMGGYASSPFGQIFWGMWKAKGARVGTAVMVTGSGAVPFDPMRYNHGAA